MEDRLVELQKLSKGNPYLGDTEELDNTGLLDDFFIESEKVRADIDLMNQTVANLRQAYLERLDQVDSRSKKKSTTDADNLVDTINKLSRKVREKLEEVGKSLPKDDGSGLNTEQRVIRNIHKALLTSFMDTMRQYQEVQSTYKERSRDIIKKQVQLVNPDATNEEVEKAIESGSEQIFSTSDRAKVASEALAYVQERHKEILKLQKSLEEVHQMFVDLAVLVEQQGEVIDRIAFNINHAKDDVLEATKELQEAHKQSKRKCSVM